MCIRDSCKSAAMCIKPFVDNYDYGTGKVFTADETYIKIRGVKAYIWFIMDAAKRSIIGYQVSDNRGVGPCILAMRMAFRHLKKLPENFHFIADGYSAYPLAAQQFFREFEMCIRDSVFSHYLIMGGFFCITEKTFIPALQATGQCSQNVLPAGYLHQPVAGSCF